MTIQSNAHTHTTHCDGVNTAAEMAQAAHKLGLSGLGFSGHSPAPFDPTCPGIKDEDAYRQDIAALKQQYAGQMSILCGVEQDYYAPVDRSAYDYIVGSVHYLPGPGGDLIAVDNTHTHVQRVRDAVYSGEGLAMVRAFYELSLLNVQKYRPDIVGHWDLIVKHNKGNVLFNEDGKEYRSLALQMADALAAEVLLYGGIVEVNTGGMARGYRDTPYPAIFVLEHLARRGVRVMINSDSHSIATLNFGFDITLEILGNAGFKSVVVLRDNKFCDMNLKELY